MQVVSKAQTQMECNCASSEHFHPFENMETIFEEDLSRKT